MDALEVNVLQVISTQSPDFLCKPDSSCFVAAGMEDVEGIDRAFLSLEQLGYVENYQELVHVVEAKVERDENGNLLRNEDGSFKYVTVTVPPVLDEDDEVIEPEQEIIDTEENTYVADQGWILTDAGKDALDNL